jgi:hypothetical protein
MKKILILSIAFVAGILLNTSTLYAQDIPISSTTSTPSATKPDNKTQKKIDKANKDLARNQNKLLAKQEYFGRQKGRYDKKNYDGDLSPNEVAKWQKSLGKLNMEMDHYKKKIAHTEKHMAVSMQQI